MASATGMAPNVAAARGQSEEEPLLGRRGDASQTEGQPLYQNLWIGEVKNFDVRYSLLTLLRHSSCCAGRHLDRELYSM